MDDDRKSELIKLGEKIEETLQYIVESVLYHHPVVPGYGILSEGPFTKYDMRITFSLNQLLSIFEEDDKLNMAEQVALVFSNEISLSLIKKVIDTLGLQRNIIYTDNFNGILNYAKVHKTPYIICSQEELVIIREHFDFKYNSNILECGPNETYKAGTIDHVEIYCNPMQSISDNSIYLLTSALIEYEFDTDRDITSTYSNLEDDVHITYNPVDIYYKQSADIDSFKRFKINEN